MRRLGLAEVTLLIRPHSGRAGTLIQVVCLSKSRVNREIASKDSGIDSMSEKKSVTDGMGWTPVL